MARRSLWWVGIAYLTIHVIIGIQAGHDSYTLLAVFAIWFAFRSWSAGAADAHAQHPRVKRP